MCGTCSVDTAGKENALGTKGSLYLQHYGEDSRREVLIVLYELVCGQTSTVASHKASYAVVKL